MKLKAFWRAATAALCAILAALLCAAALGICRDGLARRADDPLAAIYTRQNVGERLAPLVPLFAAILVLAVVGRLLGVNAPAPKRRPIEARPQPGKTRPWLSALVIAVAILLIIVGAANGGARDVLAKAANICTECVGLG